MNHDISTLPAKLKDANMAACFPYENTLLIMVSFEPMEMPRMKRRERMVRNMVFSVFWVAFLFLNVYPIPIPNNMVSMTVNIDFVCALMFAQLFVQPLKKEN